MLEAPNHFRDSMKCSKQLQDSLKGTIDLEDFRDRKVWNETSKQRREEQEKQFSAISSQFDSRRKRKIQSLTEKGASSWLTCAPTKEHDTYLSKFDFHDALKLRYDWKLRNFASTCKCGQKNDVDHALICPKGGFVIMRHNQVRDTITSFISLVSKDVVVEPLLKPIGSAQLSQSTSKDNNARLDISCRGFFRHWLEIFSMFV